MLTRLLGILLISSVLLCCVNKNVVYEMIDTEPSPGLIAAQKGRYISPQGLGCALRLQLPPVISLILAMDRIIIYVSDGLWSASYQVWRIQNHHGEYDWAAAKEALKEARIVVSELGEPLPFGVANDAQNVAMIGRISPFQFNLASNRRNSDIHLGADSTVHYDDILRAMDMGVAEHFTLAYIGDQHPFRE